MRCIYVGGQGGMVQAEKETILKVLQLNHPVVVLFDMELQGEPLPGEYRNPAGIPLWKTQKITLPHHKNTFSLELSAPFFREEQPFLIEYRLTDYDPNWRSLDETGRIEFFKVPPGHYELLSRVGHAAGYAAEPIQHFELVILSPWWFRWWAFILYVILILGGFFFFYRFLLRRQLVEAEARKLRELDAWKTDFYTNITHEFRTPLTVISGLIDEMEGYDQERTLIQKNSRRLMSLVNQILDLQKLESRQMQLQLKIGDIARFLNYLTESFQSMARRKNLRLTFYADPESILMTFDEEKMQLLSVNLITKCD